LALTGTELAHWLVYRIVYPDPYERAQILAASGHGYFVYAPLAGALVGALVLSALAARAFGRSSSAPTAQPTAAPLLLIAPLLFAIQECSEAVSVGHSPLSAVYTPTFLPGLLLQFPFAALAYASARLLARGADRLNVALRGCPPSTQRERRLALSGPRRVLPPRTAGLRGDLRERGPPLLAPCRL
jgi:hypothetical protein